MDSLRDVQHKLVLQLLVTGRGIYLVVLGQLHTPGGQKVYIIYILSLITTVSFINHFRKRVLFQNKRHLSRSINRMLEICRAKMFLRW